jgi:hypothetical protein
VCDAVGVELYARGARGGELDAAPAALEGQQIGRREPHGQIDEEALLLGERQIARRTCHDRVELVARVEVEAIDARQFVARACVCGYHARTLHGLCFARARRPRRQPQQRDQYTYASAHRVIPPARQFFVCPIL